MEVGIARGSDPQHIRCAPAPTVVCLVVLLGKLLCQLHWLPYALTPSDVLKA